MSNTKKETMTLLQKLLKIQQAVNGLKKDSASHGYSYVSGEKALSYIKPMMNDLGLILEPRVIDWDNTRIDYEVRSGSKTEILSKVRMTMTWVDVDTAEERVIPWGANGMNSFEKGFGSALTYGERYFLLKYFHIATDEDDIDNPERKKEEAPKAVGKQEGHKLSAPSELEQRFMNLITKEKALTENAKKGIAYGFKTSGWSADKMFQLITDTGVKTIKKADVENLCK